MNNKTYNIEKARNAIKHLEHYYVTEREGFEGEDKEFYVQSTQVGMCVGMVEDILRGAGFGIGITKIVKGKVTLTFWSMTTITDDDAEQRDESKISAMIEAHNRGESQ